MDSPTPRGKNGAHTRPRTGYGVPGMRALIALTRPGFALHLLDALPRPVVQLRILRHRLGRASVAKVPGAAVSPSLLAYDYLQRRPGGRETAGARAEDASLGQLVDGAATDGQRTRATSDSADVYPASRGAAYSPARTLPRLQNCLHFARTRVARACAPRKHSATVAHAL